MDLIAFNEVNEQGETVDAIRPETKSFDDVAQCIQHNAGKNDAVVDRFIEMYLIGEQWDWHDRYQDWLSRCEVIKAWNDARVITEEGELPKPRPLPVMPERPKDTTVEQWKREHYDLLRQAAYGSAASQFDMMHPGDDKWKDEWLPFIEAVKVRYPK